MAIRIPRSNKPATLAGRNQANVTARQQARNAYLQRQDRAPQKFNPIKPAPAPVQDAPVAAPAEPVAPAPVVPPADPNTLFPNTRMFEPENYQGSPLYQFQVKEGQKALARSLAQRGLTSSGHAIEEELAIPMRAAAQDTDRMTAVANQNADRLATMQANEAMRRERMGNEQWNRAFSLAELLAQQNPMQYAAAGLNNYADIMRDSGTAQANFLKDYYRRVLAAGGGGNGGGGQVNPAQLPAGPDYTNIRPTQIGANYTSNSDWLGILTTGLGSLL